MQRARQIKPAFFRNEHLAQLTAHERLLFIGLWTLCDRNGVTEDRPLRIRAELFPYESLDVDAMLDKLEQCEGHFIKRYVAPDGTKLLYVPNFEKHQHVHPNEKPSVFPVPEGYQDKSGNFLIDPVMQLDAETDQVIKPLPSLSSIPSLPSSKSAPKKPRKQRDWTPTAEFFAKLRALPAYTGINIDAELAKMDAWFLVNPLRRKSKQFIVNWMNNATPVATTARPQPMRFADTSDAPSVGLSREKLGEIAKEAGITKLLDAAPPPQDRSPPQAAGANKHGTGIGAALGQLKLLKREG